MRFMKWQRHVWCGAFEASKALDAYHQADRAEVQESRRGIHHGASRETVSALGSYRHDNRARSVFTVRTGIALDDGPELDGSRFGCAPDASPSWSSTIRPPGPAGDDGAAAAAVGRDP